MFPPSFPPQWPPPPPPPDEPRLTGAPQPGDAAPNPLGIGGLGVLVGGVLVGLSIGMEWGTEDIWGESLAASGFTTQVLWDTIPADYDSFPLMWPLLATIALMVIGVFSARRRALSVVGGVGATLIALLFLKSINSVLGEGYYDDYSFTDSVGQGAWLALAGGVIAVLGGVRHVRAGRALKAAAVQTNP